MTASRFSHFRSSKTQDPMCRGHDVPALHGKTFLAFAPIANFKMCAYVLTIVLVLFKFSLLGVDSRSERDRV